jgi:hypothetical protein
MDEKTIVFSLYSMQAAMVLSNHYLGWFCKLHQSSTQ